MNTTATRATRATLTEAHRAATAAIAAISATRNGLAATRQRFNTTITIPALPGTVTVTDPDTHLHLTVTNTMIRAAVTDRNHPAMARLCALLDTRVHEITRRRHSIAEALRRTPATPSTPSARTACTAPVDVIALPAVHRARQLAAA